MVIKALYCTLLFGNGVVIVAALVFGSRRKTVCRGAGFVNALALMVFVVPLVNLIINTDPPPEPWHSVRILLAYAAPVAAEFVALVFLWRRSVWQR